MAICFVLLEPHILSPAVTSTICRGDTHPQNRVLGAAVGRCELAIGTASVSAAYDPVLGNFGKRGIVPALGSGNCVALAGRGVLLGLLTCIDGGLDARGCGNIRPRIRG